MQRPSPIWYLGFRPFFLLGAFLAVFSMALWLLFQNGLLSRTGYLSPTIWHGHEMIFGFSSAIVAGFVLTASQNWSGLRGIHGAKLKFLVAVWLLARILLFIVSNPNFLVAAIDLSFMPLVGYFLWPYLKGADLKTERVFFLYFLLILIGNFLVHGDSLGITNGMSSRGLQLGLHTIVLIILFMGGRVIPFFTESSVAKAQPRAWNWVEWSSHGSAWAFLVSQFLYRESIASALIAFLAGGFNLLRLWGWQVPRVRRVAIIWVLHLSYFWISLGFVLSGFVSLGLLAYPVAVHSFTVGGIGLIIYGMMSRVALGHTGRPLRPTGSIILGYISLNLAGLIRVFLPLILPSFYRSAILLSGLLWIFSFLIFLQVYWPILTRARVDGRPG